jgi:hypothetical protein
MSLFWIFNEDPKRQFSTKKHFMDIGPCLKHTNDLLFSPLAVKRSFIGVSMKISRPSASQYTRRLDVLGGCMCAPPMCLPFTIKTKLIFLQKCAERLIITHQNLMLPMHINTAGSKAKYDDNSQKASLLQIETH